VGYGADLIVSKPGIMFPALILSGRLVVNVPCIATGIVRRCCGSRSSRSEHCDSCHDTGVYGGGHDTILGQTGNDTMYSDDGFSDYIDGGTGSNKCFPDPSGDTVKNC
jgi:Ca2+-binding RTX toxin-like protein